MRPNDCRKFAEQHGLCLISIADLIAYRKAKDPNPSHLDLADLSKKTSATAGSSPLAAGAAGAAAANGLNVSVSVSVNGTPATVAHAAAVHAS